ncbi:hypothetical protein MAR_012184 [Mya arenaria]|uniref:Uncharacterized protein n=1 Tax=Mya arenaria TaxID=6604 RepID=A0ABY7FWB2_MYAAR|nr:hypothetical protein MAR_012184 [Mya arenaria]
MVFPLCRSIFWSQPSTSGLLIQVGRSRLGMTMIATQRKSPQNSGKDTSLQKALLVS